MKIIAKKSLGQNFLKSKTALYKMIEAGELTEKDTVLEVGPGKGVLTEQLLKTAGRVIAVEKDHRLITLLEDKFTAEIKSGKLQLINDDILDFKPEAHNLRGGSYKLIANIPYYITGNFLRKFLDSGYQPERIVVMVQKEIAQRITARDGKESLLSISVKVFGVPKMIMKVGKENFSPAPKVDSAILLISDISKKLFIDNKVSEEKFFEILHAGFAHKRKVLLSNLKHCGQGDSTGIKIIELFKDKNIDLNVRAEDLTLDLWVGIVQQY